METPHGNPFNPTTSENWETYWQHHEAVDYVNYTAQLLVTLQSHTCLLGANVLEVGSGTGGNASELASLGAKVTTLDFAPTALRRTLATARNMGVSLLVVQADGRNLPFASGTYDVVFHQGFLEHFTDPASFIREQRRVLRDGGFLLVDVPQRYNWYTIYKHHLIRAGRWPYGGWEREFSLRELTTLLHDNGFRFVDAYGRGYYPRPLEMLRNLGKIEKKLLKRHAPPSHIWRWYDASWRRFERTLLGCNVLQCVGVLAQAAGGT
jgi:SAM-dependent methyltransferase